MVKFLHAADLHLDSPLRGLQRYEGAPVERLRQATRRALVNLVDLAQAERVAFVLLAGDLYDGDWKDYNTGLFFVAQMQRLREAGIAVYAIAGNHDAANKMTRSLRLPENVTLLSADEPQTVLRDDLGVAVHGQGFAKSAVSADLSLGYPAARRGLFNIGLLHTCATGREGHEPYAPCTLEGLRGKGYDYWALGHVHQREVLLDRPWIVFPGNVQGRHIRETGAKGCLLITVDSRHDAGLDFRPLDVLRWEKCSVSAVDAADGGAVVQSVVERLGELHREHGLPLAVRVAITGACRLHESLHADAQRWTNEVRAAALEVGGAELWIEKVELRTQPEGEPSDLEGPVGQLRAVVQQLRAEGPATIAKEWKEVDDLLRKLAAESPEGGDALTMNDAFWQGLLDEVEPLLVRRLLAGAANDGRRKGPTAGTNG